MENKRISVNLVGFIFTVIVIIALIIGVVYVVQHKDSIFKSSNQTANIENSESTEPSTNSESQNTLLDVTTPGQPTTELDSSSAKTSSKAEPISVGEWGIASKYNSNTYTEVPVKISNITRGDAAASQVKDFLDNGASIYKYEDAKPGMEWAVIEYTVNLSNITPFSSGDKAIKVDSRITGTGDNASIKYNGNTYIVSTINMTSDYTKEDIATGKFAVQLPIGCSDYLISLGSSSSTQAFFKGE